MKIFIITLLALVGLGSSHSDFFSLKGSKNFDGNSNSYYYKNNKFLNDVIRIREIKYTSMDIQNLWETICNEFENFCYNTNITEFEKAENAMLIVSIIFDFGNKLKENQLKSGCVSPRNFLLYRSENIGCCDDFAILLASFLNHLSINNQLIYFPGHVANIINVNDSIYYIDANTNLIVENFLNRKDKNFYIYPHPNESNYSRRFSILNFQNNLIENISSHVHFIYNFLSTSSSIRIDEDYLY